MSTVCRTLNSLCRPHGWPSKWQGAWWRWHDETDLLRAYFATPTGLEYRRLAYKAGLLHIMRTLGCTERSYRKMTATMQSLRRAGFVRYDIACGRWQKVKFEILEAICPEYLYRESAPWGLLRADCLRSNAVTS